MLGSPFSIQIDDACVAVNMDILNSKLHLWTLKFKVMNNLGIIITNFGLLIVGVNYSNLTHATTWSLKEDIKYTKGKMTFLFPPEVYTIHTKLLFSRHKKLHWWEWSGVSEEHTAIQLDRITLDSNHHILFKIRFTFIPHSTTNWRTHVPTQSPHCH